MALFQKLNRDSGMSIIVVTHEPDIASYSNRIIRFKDGHLVSDERVADPRDAQLELETLPAEEPEPEEVVAL
jgi:putative ABC transport system ATP-binding protein